jgi:hypothetical protein
MIECTISFSIHGLSVVGKSVLSMKCFRNIHNIWIYPWIHMYVLICQSQRHLPCDGEHPPKNSGDSA